jgi:hypothetical protein
MSNGLALALLVTRLLADDEKRPATADVTAMLADLLERSFYFHGGAV